MKTFVEKDSIIRKIWGTTDVTLFIFAGASAEFALNKQVDWLYFTGSLPADPIGRLFSTVQYAQHIIFREEADALSAISRINNIHHKVEVSRGGKIPEASYKDVLYMLIYYSVAAFELLERKLTKEEKDEIITTFNRIGSAMNITGLPSDYQHWLHDYSEHLHNNLDYSNYTKDLFRQYKKHLGLFKYYLLLEVQRCLVSKQVNRLLSLGKPLIAALLLPVYRVLRKNNWLRRKLMILMVPARFQEQIRIMDSYSIHYRED